MEAETGFFAIELEANPPSLKNPVSLVLNGMMQDGRKN
jgi:hypothetical protein